jgi:HK97 family phage prohead protease
MADAKEPYGPVSYADPGYLDADGNQASKSGKPGVKRYPLSADKVMAAWTYINQAKNAGQYTPAQLSAIKGRIKSAMAKHGHQVSDTGGDTNSAAPDGDGWAERWLESVLERFNTVHVPAGSATGGQFGTSGGSSAKSGAKTPAKKAAPAHHMSPAHAAEKARLLAEAHKATAEAATLEHVLAGLEKQAATAQAAAKKSAAAAKAAAKAGHVIHHRKHAAAHKRHAAHHASLKQKITALKGQIHALRVKAAGLTRQANAIRSAVDEAMPGAWARRASDLKYGHGSALWKYWTSGEGFAKWSAAVHKWTTLRDLLLKAGVPPQMADGLTTNIITAVMPGYMKQAHAQEKNMTHFAPDLDVVRSGGGMELQPAQDGTLGTLTGRFSEFGRWYRVSSKMEGDFLERVTPGATADTIRDNRDSMRVLFDHGMDAQIGNKVLGPIDVLEEKSDGPHYEVPLFDTSYNRDLLPGLKAGVYGASMRMRVTGDKWDDKPARSGDNPDGLPERTITAMKVLEFGPVTFPANPGASAGVRSGTDEFYHRLRLADAPAFEDAVRAAGLPLPEDFTGRDGARSAPGGEEDDASQANGGTSPPPPNPKTVLRDRAWRMRGQPSG